MPHPGWSRFSFEGIGTHWEISTSSILALEVQRQLLGTVADYDHTYSRFRPDSLVSALQRGPGSISLPGHSVALRDLYEALYRITGGSMTPLIGNSLNRLGYDAGYTLVPSGAPEGAVKWEDVLEWSGTTVSGKVTLVLDVGAAGKGQLVDLLGEVLR